MLQQTIIEICLPSWQSSMKRRRENFDGIEYKSSVVQNFDYIFSIPKRPFFFVPRPNANANLKKKTKRYLSLIRNTCFIIFS